ncbi:MAG: hypothetical protein ACYSTZ_11450, partial [Planctomycetota bacterium]
MTERPATLATLSRILKLLVITSVAVFITQAKASEDSLLSSCPAIDTTGKAFAEGRLDVAAQRFEAISRDASAPSFARGLALFGSAEVALARQDPNAAIAAWDCLAADEKLLRFHRDTAMRRIAEAKRL